MKADEQQIIGRDRITGPGAAGWSDSGGGVCLGWVGVQQRSDRSGNQQLAVSAAAVFACRWEELGSAVSAAHPAGTWMSGITSGR